MTPDERLAWFLADRGLTRKAVADALGLTTSSFTSHFSSRSKTRTMLTLALQSLYSIRSAWLLQGTLPEYVPQPETYSAEARVIARTFECLDPAHKRIVRLLVAAFDRIRSST